MVLVYIPYFGTKTLSQITEILSRKWCAQSIFTFFPSPFFPWRSHYIKQNQRRIRYFNSFRLNHCIETEPVHTHINKESSVTFGQRKQQQQKWPEQPKQMWKQYPNKKRNVANLKGKLFSPTFVAYISSIVCGCYKAFNARRQQRTKKNPNWNSERNIFGRSKLS